MNLIINKIESNLMILMIIIIQYTMSSLLKDVNPHIRDRNIKFYEKGHIYYVKRERGYKSVTTLSARCFNLRF